MIFGPLGLEDYYRMLPGGTSKSSSVEITPEMIAKPPMHPVASMLEVWGQAARSSGVSLDRLMAAVRSYTGDELQWDLQLILKKQETPPLGLGIVGRLGWSSWLLRDPMPRDPDDLVLDAMRVPETSRAFSSPEFANGARKHWVKPAMDSTLWLPSIRRIRATTSMDDRAIIDRRQFSKLIIDFVLAFA